MNNGAKNIGEKIRCLRVKINLTQEELANRCGLSKGFISQVERELNSPSIATLSDILECLGTSLKDFFTDNENTKVVFPKEDVVVQENSEFSIGWLIPNAQKNDMEPIYLCIKKRSRTTLYEPHDGDIFGYVIKGAVCVNLGKNKHRAKKGESFYYNANEQYFIENNSGSDADIIMVSTPPSF